MDGRYRKTIMETITMLMEAYMSGISYIPLTRAWSKQKIKTLDQQR